MFSLSFLLAKCRSNTVFAQSSGINQYTDLCGGCMHCSHSKRPSCATNKSMKQSCVHLLHTGGIFSQTGNRVSPLTNGTASFIAASRRAAIAGEPK